MLDIKAFDTKGLKNEESILAAAAKIGTNALTDVSVFVRFATFLFSCGLAFKAGTFKPNSWDMAKVFAAFNDAFRDASNGHRKELKESSVETWVSAFGAYYEAGQWTAYDIGDIVEASTKLEGSFTTRGAKLRRVMKDYKTDAPTAEQLEAIFNPTPKADKNPVNTLAKKILASLDDKRLDKNDPEAMAILKTNARLRIALVAIRVAAKAFVTASEASAGETGLSPEDELAQLQATLSAPPATTVQ
jgi:hypothetical protein